jgi:DNA-binding CsgD family transcriptional regulator
VQPAQRTELLKAAAELSAVSLVATEVLPELTRATHSAMVFLYEAGPSGVTVFGPTGAAELVHTYFRDFVADCPLHKLKEHTDGQVVSTTRIATTRGYMTSTVYRAFFRPNELDHHLAVRLLPAGTERGELGLMLNRAAGQGEYSDKDVQDMRSMVPSLTAALRMGTRLDAAHKRNVALESRLFDSEEGTSTLVVDEGGRLVHIQSREGAAEIAAIATSLADRKHPLMVACRALLEDDPEVPLELVHELVTPTRSVYRAELNVTASLSAGVRLVVVTLSRAMLPHRGWMCWGLSRAETTILHELIAGHSNVEIGRKLFISPETVRTHLTKIFKKMGVRSRLEAAVLAMRAGAQA